MMRFHAAALVLAFLLWGCEDGARMWIAEVSAESAAAQAAEARGDRAAALEALGRLLDREVPGEVAEEDARVVRQDAHERRARLFFEAGDLDRAGVEVDRGLSLGQHEDVFTANLLTWRGRIREASGQDREAARDYHRALRIHEALLDRVLGR